MSCSNEIFIQIKENFIRSTNYGINIDQYIDIRYNVQSIYIANGKEISHMPVFWAKDTVVFSLESIDQIKIQ